MAREYGPVNVEIWADPAWRALPPAAQHLYLLLWTSPSLSYCGVHDWRPGRLAALANGFNADHIEAIGNCLAARHFLVMDNDTEEVLVRSWARFDGLLKKPRMAVSFANAYASVASPVLRSVLVTEVKKIRDLAPDWACWLDKRVVGILEHPATSAKDLPPVCDPFADGFVDGFALGLPQTAAAVCLPPTPAPTPTPYSISLLGQVPEPEAAVPSSATTQSKANRKRQLPDDFRPSDKHVDLAQELGVDLRAEWPKFCDHHVAKGSTMVDWNAALRTWIRNAKRFGNVRQLPSADDNSWMRRTR